MVRSVTTDGKQQSWQAMGKIFTDYHEIFDELKKSTIESLSVATGYKYSAKI